VRLDRRACGPAKRFSCAPGARETHAGQTTQRWRKCNGFIAGVCLIYNTVELGECSSATLKKTELRMVNNGGHVLSETMVALARRTKNQGLNV
jgi:hypothetical protein